MDYFYLFQRFFKKLYDRNSYSTTLMKLYKNEDAN